MIIEETKMTRTDIEFDFFEVNALSNTRSMINLIRINLDDEESLFTLDKEDEISKADLETTFRVLNILSKCRIFEKGICSERETELISNFEDTLELEDDDDNFPF